MDKQLQTAGQEIIQNWLQKRYSHPFRPSNINHFRLSGRALSKKRETPSYPPVRGRLVTFSSLVKSEKWRVKNRADAVGKPQAEERNLSSPKGDRRGSFYSIAHFINLLTNEIHSRKSVRKYAILAHSATLWPSEHCKTGGKMTDFFRPKSTENRPKSIDIEWWKHGYCRVIT